MARPSEASHVTRLLCTSVSSLVSGNSNCLFLSCGCREAVGREDPGVQGTRLCRAGRCWLRAVREAPGTRPAPVSRAARVGGCPPVLEGNGSRGRQPHPIRRDVRGMEGPGLWSGHRREGIGVQRWLLQREGKVGALRMLMGPVGLGVEQGPASHESVLLTKQMPGESLRLETTQDLDMLSFLVFKKVTSAKSNLKYALNTQGEIPRGRLPFPQARSVHP